MKGNWNNKDWKWLTGILIGIIIIILSLWLSNYQTNFSIISSAVSIALALVAIYMALQQNKDNNDTKLTISEMKNDLLQQLNDVGTKVDSMGYLDVNKIIDSTLNNENQSDSYSKEEVEKLISQAIIESKNKELSNYNKISNHKKKNSNRYVLQVTFSNNSESLKDRLVSKIGFIFQGTEIMVKQKQKGQLDYEIIFSSPFESLDFSLEHITNLLNPEKVTVNGIFKIG